MTLKLDVRDLPDRLEYRVTQSHTRIYLILRTLAWTIAIALALTLGGQSLLFAIFLSGMLLYYAVVDIQKAKRGTDVTLTITQRDIASDGYSGRVLSAKSLAYPGTGSFLARQSLN